jgi:polar amino acid transport system substrate-binding protein
LTEKNTCIFPINFTEERKNLFQWIAPTQVGGWAIFQHPEGDIHLDSIADVKAYELVGKISSHATAEVERIIGRSVLRTSGDEDSIKLLYRGRADLWISGVYDAPAAARKMNMPEPKMVLNWKPATFGIGCSLTTAPAIVASLKQANQRRLNKLEAAGLSKSNSAR